MSLWYSKTGQFNIKSYSDVDNVGCRVDRKSTSKTGQFLESYLVPWSSKNQNYVALLTGEAEYVAAGACCALVLWMKHTLLNYDMHYDHIKIFCDNTSTIHMIKNAN